MPLAFASVPRHADAWENRLFNVSIVASGPKSPKFRDELRGGLDREAAAWFLLCPIFPIPGPNGTPNEHVTVCVIPLPFGPRKRYLA
jgi:hypothetical protein